MQRLVIEHVIERRRRGGEGQKPTEKSTESAAKKRRWRRIKKEMNGYGALCGNGKYLYLGTTRGRVERRLADRVKTLSDDMLAFGVLTAAIVTHLSCVQTRNLTLRRIKKMTLK
jgi:hypothetical protein